MGIKITDYKLKVVEGKVKYLLRTGKDLVQAQMDAKQARFIMNKGTLGESPNRKFPIGVDDTYFFEGEIERRKEPFINRGGKRK